MSSGRPAADDPRLHLGGPGAKSTRDGWRARFRQLLRRPRHFGGRSSAKLLSIARARWTLECKLCVTEEHCINALREDVVEF